MTTHDQYKQPSPTWEEAKLDPEDAEYLREQLSEIPHLAQAFNELGGGLDEEGSSRTVFQLPINLSVSNAESAMLSTAREAARAIREQGLDELRGSLVVRENGQPEDFGEVELPAGAKASIDPESPFGYIRIEQTEDGRQASVGCLDPKTRVHYSEILR